MLKEYAVDPALAGHFQTLNLISALFDYRNPRRISRFPKTWERMVCDAAGEIGDLNKARVVEKLKQLKDSKFCLWSFGRSYDPTKAWIENANRENLLRAFAAIISNSTGSYISADEIEESNPLLSCNTDFIVPKSDDNALVGILQAVLHSAKEIIFIDPFINFYTDPSARRYKQSFTKLIETIRKRENGIPFRVTFCFSEKLVPALKAVSDIKTDIQTLFGLKTSEVSVVVLPEAVAHNRYILTDIASFSLGDSLWYEVNQVREDHMAMMSHDSYIHHRQKYCP